MKCLMLPSFDDGSFECHNFWINDCDGTYQIDAESALIQDLRSRIETEMSKGKRHLNVSKLEVVYGAVQVLEVLWD